MINTSNVENICNRWEVYIADTVSIKDTKKGIEIMARKKDRKIKKENIEVMSLDNKPINKEVIKEPVNIPDKFVKIPKRVEHTKTINVRNGRVYKELGNGYGVYSDDGSVFKI